MVAPRHVYIHVPFCARRCVYCDFAIAVRREVPVAEFVQAVERELEIRFPKAVWDSPGRSGPAEDGRTPLGTLYLGGGTPSKLGAAGVRQLIDAIRRTWVVGQDTEVTIEANPEDVTPDVASAWLEAGVTRVSLGIQSFDDDVLRWMHRTHDAAQAVQAAGALRGAGLEDWSLDLIFALPPEVNRSWERDLRHAIELQPAHVSCYGLTVEPRTPLVRLRERGAVRDADEARYESEFLAADALLSQAGYQHYEVSNYAREGRRSRHNSACWRRVSYVGLGPSAHSFDGSARRWNEREYAAWIAAVAAGRDPVGGREELASDSVALEESYLGLRTSDGVPLTEGNGGDFECWTREGWAEVRGGRGCLTPLGWLRLDSLAAALTDARSR